MARMQTLLPEFDHEMAATRKVLARVPMERADWRPHPKSMSLGRLANHLVGLLIWGPATFATDAIDFAQGKFPAPEHASTAELLAGFDAIVAETRSVFAAATDEVAEGPWTLRLGDQIFFTLPRHAVVRSFVMNHLIHHRAQLTVYLRLLDLPVPALYGPSADEA